MNANFRKKVMKQYLGEKALLDNKSQANYYEDDYDEGMKQEKDQYQEIFTIKLHDIQNYAERN